MKTSHLIIFIGALFILPYEGKIFRRLREGLRLVGGIAENGFLRYRLKEVYFNYHDVIYENFYKTQIPNHKFIFHLNGDITDNRIDNLLLLEKGFGKKNNDALKHIFWSKTKNCYEIRINVEGIKRYYGYYNKLENAINRRNEVYIELNNLGLHYNT